MSTVAENEGSPTLPFSISQLDRPAIRLSAIFFLVFAILVQLLPVLRIIIYSLITGSVVICVVYTAANVLIVRNWKASDISHHPLKNFKPLAFTAPTKWSAEIDALRRQEVFPKTALYRPSFVISSALDSLLGLIVRDFVMEWYQKISKDAVFSRQVEKTIRFALGSIIDRAQQIDVSEVLVQRIVPILTNHLSEFSLAEKAVRGKHLNMHLTESEELDLAIAGKYKEGRLHPAASLASSDPKLAQQDHLRKLVTKILPLVLPAKEAQSRAVFVVTQELVSCALLSPIFTLLADPDTWNQLMEIIGRSTLQDRKTVEKLRAALDEHATPDKTSRRLIFGRLTPRDDERSYERFIRSIRICTNLSDVRRLRNEISSQLKRDSRIEGQDQLYLRRLENTKRLLDQKVAYLSSGTGQKSSKSALSSSSSNGTSGLEHAELIDILRNSSGLSYFMEFMDRRKRIALVQFWMLVDGIRNPLEVDPDEDEYIVPTQTNWSSTERNDFAQIYDTYLSLPELDIPEASKTAIKTFLRAGRNALPSQYMQARGAILRAQTATYENMAEEDFPKFRTSDLFYKHMASDDVVPSVPVVPNTIPSLVPLIPPARTMSPIKEFHRTTSVVNAHKLNPPQQDQLTTRHSFEEKRPKLFDDDWDIDALSQSRQSLDGDGTGLQSPGNGVVEAMEAALTDIMGSPSDLDDESRRPSLQTPDHSRPNIFDNDDLFESPRTSMDGKAKLARTPSVAGSKSEKREKPSLATLGLVSTFAAKSVFAGEELFPDEAHDISEIEDTKSSSEAEDDAEQVHEAAPGDLGLAEAISELNFSIDKLHTQEAIIDSMLKKAELTNNAAELRILNKSKASLQREIRRNELQRQQYLVQESDNSLYGRATIRMTRSMVGTEHGKEYGIYIIDVRRKSGDGEPDVEWSIAKRYSEFFQLHSELRTKFASVKNLEFPRRKMVLKLQRDFLDKRRIALQSYLRALLLRPDVCRSRELRGFLSQQTLPPPVTSHGDSIEENRDFISKLYNSIADGMEDVIGNLPLLEQLSQQLSLATINLNTSYATTNNSSQPVLRTTTIRGDEINVQEAEAELSTFDDKGAPPFVKPICDIFLETFELNKGSSWLRGRAVVVVLHQLLGGTVERKVREQTKLYTNEENVLKYIQLLRDTMWPNGVFQRERPIRSVKERKKSKVEASVMLATLVPDMSASVVGRANAQAASRRLFAVFNNQRLNSHVAFKILDVLVDVLFPEFANTQN